MSKPTSDPHATSESNIPQQQFEALKQTFALFDKDGSGSIDILELRACLKSMGIYPSPLELEHLMSLMDTDGNGTIEFDEFVAVMADELDDEGLEKELEELKTVFTLLDKNGDGGLSSHELSQAMKSMGLDLTKEEANYLINQIDLDGNGEVSFEEFAAYVLNFDEGEHHSDGNHSDHH